MNNLDGMWNLSSSILKKAVGILFPIQITQAKPPYPPYWFNKRVSKLGAKHSKISVSTQMTRSTCINTIKRSENANLNSTPLSKNILQIKSVSLLKLDRHFKWSQGVTKPPMRLLTIDDTHTQNPNKCTEWKLEKMVQ